MLKNPVLIDLTNNKLVAISRHNLQETDRGKGPAKQPRIVLSKLTFHNKEIELTIEDHYRSKSRITDQRDNCLKTQTMAIQEEFLQKHKTSSHQADNLQSHQVIHTLSRSFHTCLPPTISLWSAMTQLQ
jgi:hypothetical protein